MLWGFDSADLCVIVAQTQTSQEVKELATNMVWPIVWHIDANDIVDPATHQLGLVESLRLVAQFCTTPRGLEVLSVPFAWQVGATQSVARLSC